MSAVIEFEHQVTRASGVLALVTTLQSNQTASALLASAAGAEELADEQAPTDAELIAAYDAQTRPLDTTDLH